MSECDDRLLELAWEDWRLDHDGLLDPGQPTLWGHLVHRHKMRAEFTPVERALIRSAVFGAALGEDTI